MLHEPAIITPEHIRQLWESRAIDAALVRYQDDLTYEVRSRIPYDGPDRRYRTVITKEGLEDYVEGTLDPGDEEWVAEAMNASDYVEQREFEFWDGVEDSIVSDVGDSA